MFCCFFFLQATHFSIWGWIKFIVFICALFRIQEERLHWRLEANADLLSPTGAYPSFEEISTGETVEGNFSIFILFDPVDCFYSHSCEPTI